MSHSSAPQMPNVTVDSRPTSLSAHLCRRCLIPNRFDHNQSRALTALSPRYSGTLPECAACPVSPFGPCAHARDCCWAGFHLVWLFTAWPWSKADPYRGTGHLPPGTGQAHSHQYHSPGTVCSLNSQHFPRYPSDTQRTICF